MRDRDRVTGVHPDPVGRWRAAHGPGDRPVCVALPGWYGARAVFSAPDRDGDPGRRGSIGTARDHRLSGGHPEDDPHADPDPRSDTSSRSGAHPCTDADRGSDAGCDR